MKNMPDILPFFDSRPVARALPSLCRLAGKLWAPLAVLALAGCVSAPTAEQAPASPPVAVAVPAQSVPPPTAPAAVKPQVPEQIFGQASPEKNAMLREWVEQHARLYAVAAPLLINNTALCKRQARPLLGFTAKTRFSYNKEFVGSAEESLGLDDNLRVTDILPGSGAAKSGIERGDILLAIEDKSLPQGAQAERAASKLIGAVMRNRASLKLTVLRGDEHVKLNVSLTRACAFSIELGDTDEVNSYSDGYRVMITRGMLNFARSDEELAYALAKEIAHGILTRAPRPRMRAMINSLQLATDNSPRAAVVMPAPYSPVLDATADKLALYLLARAGHNLDNVIPFWKRLAAQYPPTISRGHTALHPATAYRMSVMNQVLHHIKAKKKHKKPLLPT